MQIKDPRTTNGYKDLLPRCHYRMLWSIHHWKRAAHTANLKTKTGLLQYRDTVPIPNTYIIADSDVFCDTLNLQLNHIPSCADKPNLLERLTHIQSTVITPLVDSIDVLYNYKFILYLTGEAGFFNSCYNRQDQAISLHNSIFVQTKYLRHRDGCTDSTQEVYVPSSGDEFQIVIDTGLSNSITPCPADFMGGKKRSSIKFLIQVDGTTPVCGEGKFLWDIKRFYETRQSTITES